MPSTAYDNLSLADTDISMAQSWAPKDPDSATFLPALQAQVNGPMPQDPRHITRTFLARFTLCGQTCAPTLPKPDRRH